MSLLCVRETDPLGDALFRDGQLTLDERGARAAGTLVATLGLDVAVRTAYDLSGDAGIELIVALAAPLGICTCPYSIRPDSPCGPHTVAEHERSSCRHSMTIGMACGGCWDCMDAQHRYYERIDRGRA